MKKNAKNSESECVSERKCEADGKRFVVVRHFVGDRDLDAILAEIAVLRADAELLK